MPRKKKAFSLAFVTTTLVRVDSRDRLLRNETTETSRWKLDALPKRQDAEEELKKMWSVSSTSVFFHSTRERVLLWQAAEKESLKKKKRLCTARAD